MISSIVLVLSGNRDRYFIVQIIICTESRIKKIVFTTFFRVSFFSAEYMYYYFGLKKTFFTTFSNNFPRKLKIENVVKSCMQYEYFVNMHENV